MYVISLIWQVAVGFVKECGAILQDLTPQGLHGELLKLTFSVNAALGTLFWIWLFWKYIC